MAPSLRRSPSVYIPRESSLAVRVMQISITTWSAHYNFFITAWIMLLIATVISATFCNILRWSRSCCNVWNVGWPGDVTDSMNVGGYQWNLLLRLSCSWTEGLILEWQCSQKEERPRGSGFFGRMSVLGAIDSSEGGVSSGTVGRCSQEEVLLGVPCCLFFRVPDEMRYMSWSWCMSEIDHYINCEKL